MTRHGRLLAALTLVWMMACAVVRAEPGAGGWNLGDPAAHLAQPVMQVLHDASGRLSVADVAALPPGAFRPRRPGESFGFHEGTIWLRWTMHNDSAAASQRWLVLPRLLQERVALHLVRPDGAVQSFRSGSAVPLSQRDLPGSTLMFPLEVEGGGSRTGYLSLSGRALSLTYVEAWHPAAYLDAQTRLTAVKYLAIGLGMVLALAGAMAAHVHQRRGLWLGAVGYLMIVLYMLLRDGLGTGLLPAGDGLWTQRLIQMVAGAAMASLAHFAHVFLGMDRLQRPRAWLLRLATSMAVVATVYPIALPHPEAGMVLLIGASAVMLVVALLGLGRTDVANRSFLLAWTTFWLTVTLRLGANASWLNLPWLPLDLPVMGLVAAALILSVGLVLTARNVGRQSRQVRQELLRQQASENERLRDAVLERTAELDQARQRAERESQAKSTFLSTMAHELRSPLHALLGYAGLLQRQIRGSGRDHVTLIERHGRRLLQMVDQALIYSRGEAEAIELEPAPVALEAWLRELIDGRRTAMADAMAGSAHAAASGGGGGDRLKLLIDGALPAAVDVDEQRLGQVLGNLLDNALKYAPEGPVVLRVSRLDSDASGHVGHPSCMLRFEVIDQGPGIPAAQQAQAFQPFVRLPAQRHQPGVGLGLTIAASLVGRMGGRLRLHSEPGTGCRFEFELTLPVVEPSALAGSPPAGLPKLVNPGDAGAVPSTAVPPATMLEPLRPMLELGQMIGMARWLEEFGAREPAWREFAQQARSLCLMADLHALERWLASAPAPATTPATAPATTPALGPGGTRPAPTAAFTDTASQHVHPTTVTH